MAKRKRKFWDKAEKAQAQDAICAFLQTGHSLKRSCEKAGVPSGTARSWRYWNEGGKLRLEKLTDFGERVKKILDTPEHQSRLAMAQTSQKTQAGDPKQLFLDTLRVERDRVAALGAVGWTVGQLTDYLRDDEEFRHAYDDAYSKIKLAMEDAALRLAAVNENPAMLRHFVPGVSSKHSGRQPDDRPVINVFNIDDGGASLSGILNGIGQGSGTEESDQSRSISRIGISDSRPDGPPPNLDN